MFSASRGDVRLLDAGAGAGSLTAAAVAAMLAHDHPPGSIEVVAYEVDPLLEPFLRDTLDACDAACNVAGVSFTAHIEATDFLKAASEHVGSGARADFTAAILNPPYRKIRASSDERAWCRAMGLEVSNLYAAFVGATLHLLKPGAGAGRDHAAELR